MQVVFFITERILNYILFLDIIIIELKFSYYGEKVLFVVVMEHIIFLGRGR
jgi:hypothetical protein